MKDFVMKRHKPLAVEDDEIGGTGATVPLEDTIELDGRTYMTQDGLARKLRTTVRTLSRWHDLRIGPPRSKVGNLVLYDRGKLAPWLESHEEMPSLARKPSIRGAR